MGLLKLAGLVSTAEAGMSTTVSKPARSRTIERATTWWAACSPYRPGVEHALEHVLELHPEGKNTR